MSGWVPRTGYRDGVSTAGSRLFSSLAPQRSPAGEMLLNPSGGRTRDGQPYQPLVLTAADLWLSPTGASTRFALDGDSGGMVGAATQASVSYDLTGDGTWDRVETYRYFATDPKAGPERYTQDVGLRSSEGQLGESCAEGWSNWSCGRHWGKAASSSICPALP